MINTALLIIGAGAAGLSCAISARNHAGPSLKILLLDTLPYVGGILPQCLHSGFGLSIYGEELTGAAFLERMKQELPDSVDLLLEATVTRILPDRTAQVRGPFGHETIAFRHLVLACGCREKSLSSLPVAGTRPSGVMDAGLAQQLVNLKSADIGRRIVILGSGDIGLVMAGRFAELGKVPVAIIEMKDQMGGLLRNQRRFVEKNHIPVITRATIDELHGSPRLEGVTIRHLDTGEREYMECDTLVTSLGLIPEQELIKDVNEDNSPLPDWISLAGNCSFVHEIVDRVVREGEETGRRAAEKLTEGETCSM